MKKQLFYLLLAAGVLSACGPAAPQLGKDSVEDVIGAMTLEEKAHLVIGTGMVGTSGDSTVIGTTEVGSRCSRYYLSDTPFGNSCHCAG